jgi:O-antigen ligase
VPTIAVLTGAMPKLGVLAVAILAAGVLLSRTERARAVAMLGALVLAPTLLLVDIWHSPQLRLVHHHPLVAVALAVVALMVVGLLAALINRRPTTLAVLAVVALPFRIPIQAGGTTSNLLVPLYLVVAAGSLAFIVPALSGRWPPGTEADGAGPLANPGVLERLLALYVVLYGLQATYSSDFEKALQQMVFFYVPFALMFFLLARLQWNGRLIRQCLTVTIALALLFAALGFVEYATKTLILNPRLVAANDVHAYFTVNSVFFDPDIFGRFLVLVMIAVAAGLLQRAEPRRQLGATGVLAVLWGGLVLTLSRSSLGALLVGLATLAALRWRMRWALLVAGAVVVIGVATIAISPKTFGLNQGLNGASSGRAGLVSGGLDLFGNRPLWGYGSGSFVNEYQLHNPGSSQTLSASHTIPITIAAEQGLIGEVVYLALVLVAIMSLLRGARSDPARAAIAAAFIALVFHTLLYADFLEDPFTWTLLGVGTALGMTHPAQLEPRRMRRPRVATAAA